jgi:hypothetical protein
MSWLSHMASPTTPAPEAPKMVFKEDKKEEEEDEK